MDSAEKILRTKYGFEKPFKPDPLALRAMHFIKNGTNLLDAGCGEGADSVFYADQGFEVIAIDENREYLNGLRSFAIDHELSNLEIKETNLLEFQYPKNYYDVISCLLVGCCMKKSEFQQLLPLLKDSVKRGGYIIMSLRNYLDAEFQEYTQTEKMIEPNTFRKKDDCCKIRYYIEKDQLRKSFSEFDIIYYFEGCTPDKYEDVDMHGDSYIICRKK